MKKKFFSSVKVKNTLEKFFKKDTSVNVHCINRFDSICFVLSISLAISAFHTVICRSLQPYTFIHPTKPKFHRPFNGTATLNTLIHVRIHHAWWMIFFSRPYYARRLQSTLVPLYSGQFLLLLLLLLCSVFEMTGNDH